MEYTKFAKDYDIFYKNKDYLNEVKFIENNIKQNSYILDLGCGTGRHALLLEKDGYIVDGVDLNVDMLNIAKERIHGNLYNQNILDLNIQNKYDVIISMFAVLNHLSNLDELDKCFNNMSKLLNDKGIIIIDLHNPQSSGSKLDKYGDISRKMTWNIDGNIEKTEIIFNDKDITYHEFRIFNIYEIKNACLNNNLEVIKVCENYNCNLEGKRTSKNLQFIIKKR